MLIAGFPSGSLRANCYVVAPAAGGECVVIDPGEDAAGPLQELLHTHRLTPAAVLLTHGHLDHIASAAEVCRSSGVPAHLHAADEKLLDDPLSGLSPELAAALVDFPSGDLRPPQVRPLQDGLSLAGLEIAVDHTPGHTPGSVVFRIAAEQGRPEVLFTGDTLFAGSVGRTDLPGGSWQELQRSLCSALLTRPDDAVVLPGHGGTTTIGAQRAGNPFLTT